MINMVQSNASSGADELEDISEILKVRNRRLRQRPINGYVEFYLKYEPYCSSDDKDQFEIANEIVAIIDQIEYCEKQVAQFEAAELMLKESCLVE